VAIIERFSSVHSWIRLVNNPDRITPVALNLGIKNSRGDVVIILGAHTEIDPGFLVNCVKALEANPEAACAGGIIESRYQDSSSEAIGLAMTSAFGVGNAHFRTGARDGFVDTVAYGAYRREIFDKVGYFDEVLVRNQDDEFNFRLTKAGLKIYLSRDIRSVYYVRTGFKKLFSQYYQYGFWKVLVNKKHHTITTFRQLVPFFFVLFLCLAPPASLFSIWILAGSLLVLAVYFLAGWYAASRLAKGAAKRFQVIRAFLTLHLSYGFGYLAGVIRFILLGRNPYKHK
jgi:GT2 family glycosyltransferase